MTTDYSRLGLRVGIEIHQQLATSNKLFCGCRAELSTSPPTFSFYRRLRPTQSELGAVDPAAAFEFQRGRGFQYEADNQTSCLVEIDEEPPHELNEDAVEVCLTAALMIHSQPVEEVHDHAEQLGRLPLAARQEQHQGAGHGQRFEQAQQRDYR